MKRTILLVGFFIIAGSESARTIFKSDRYNDAFLENQNSIDGDYNPDEECECDPPWDGNENSMETTKMNLLSDETVICDYWGCDSGDDVKENSGDTDWTIEITKNDEPTPEPSATTIKITPSSTERTPEPSTAMTTALPTEPTSEPLTVIVTTTAASPTEPTSEPLTVIVTTTAASPTEPTPEPSTTNPMTTTLPTEPTTTTAPPTTPPPCPDSIIAAKDLKDMIRFFTNQSNAAESIKNSYYEDAVNMRDTHLKALKTFSEWFINQPKHLKQIVEDLSQNQKIIELNLSKIAKYLRDAFTLEEYHTLEAKIVALEKDSNNTEKMCNYFCSPHPLLSRRTLFIADVATKVHDEDRYCGKLGEIHDKIKARLTTFVANTQDSLKTRIKQENELYIGKVERLENKLKDTALTTFGRTMYDVLNLIADYRNLEKRSNVDEIRGQVIRNKESRKSVELRLLKLGEYNNGVKEKCRKCSIDYALGSYLVQNQNEDKDLLEKMLDENEQELMNTVNAEYKNIFESLEDDLDIDNPEKVNKYLVNLEKLHDEVISLTKTERETFTKTLESFPDEELKDQEAIADGVEVLSKTLDAIKEKLKKIDESVH